MSADLSSKLAALRIDRPDAYEPPPRRSYTWVGWVIALVVLGGLGLEVWKRIERKMNTPKVTLTSVSVVSATDGLVSLTATGYVVPQRTARLGAEAFTKVLRTNVREGQLVKAGDVLFELDATDARAAIDSANARLGAARSRVTVAQAERADTAGLLARERNLVGAGISNQATVEDLGRRLAMLDARISSAQADVRSASAEVAALEAGLTKFTVVAPFDGRVVSKPVEPGSVPVAGGGLVDLMDPTSLLIEADVPESRLSNVRVDSPCEVTFDSAPDARFVGKVVGFGTRVDRAKATGLVRIALETTPEAYLPDMGVRIRFLKEAAPTAQAAPKTIVPADALFACDGGKCVFTVEQGVARRVRVELGASAAGGFELVSGPGVGARLIQSPPATLQDGQTEEEAKP
jgi:RND family efflux transporter MFP subunit